MPWESRATSGGILCSQWVQPVPRIPDLILNSIIYICDDIGNARIGIEAGASGLYTPWGLNYRD